MGLNAENVIFINSFEKGAGSSFVAVNIAYGLILEGKRVIIAGCGGLESKSGIPKIEGLKENKSKAIFKIQTNLGYIFLRNFETEIEIDKAAEKYGYNDIDYIIVDVGTEEIPKIVTAKKKYGITVMKEKNSFKDKNESKYWLLENSIFIGIIQNMSNTKKYYEKFQEMVEKKEEFSWEAEKTAAVIPFEKEIETEEKMWIPYIYKNYGSDAIEALKDIIDIILDFEEEKGNEILKEKTVTILLNSENKPVKENENCKDYLYVTYKGKNIIKIIKTAEKIIYESDNLWENFSYTECKNVAEVIQKYIKYANSSRWHNCS